MKMVVLVVDRSVLIIERLQQMLSEAEYVTAVYGAVSYKDASRYFKETAPDVVLLDSGLPWNSCTAILKEIKAANIQTQVIVLANRVDEQITGEYDAIGADFFFDKYHDFEKIPGVINALANIQK
jgi:DNA-binding NarL/FixJ family response regulator